MANSRIVPFPRTVPRGVLRMATGALALLAAASPASADVCSSTPVSLPGLSGPPLWTGTAGTVRTELNEPRWAGAPQMQFESDITGVEGIYRVMVDAAFTELSVSFQAPTDPSAPSAADAVYFGFSTDGTAATLAKAVVMTVPAGTAADPVAVTGITQKNFDVTATPSHWTSVLGAPTWLKTPYAWRLPGSGAAWGINFKVDLTAAGLSPAMGFKIMLAMHKQDEMTPANSINVSTPYPGANPLLAGTRIIDDPTKWANATAIDLGCAAGITIDGSQIGTRNVFMGNPAPSLINTTSGGVNHFYATPTIPGSLPLVSGLFQATFHIANWGSIADLNAAWTALNAAPVKNGSPPAPDDGTVEFQCPPNTASAMCGITPIPAQTHQCVYVELSSPPGQNTPFTRAAAYRNMDFKPLSDFTAPAQISVKGLKAKLGNDNPRDVYVYIYPKNMPPPGKDALFLPTDKMAATRRFAASPPRPSRHVDKRAFLATMKARDAAIKKDEEEQKRAAEQKKRAGANKTAVLAQGMKKAAPVPPKKQAPKGPPAPLRKEPLPQTGIGDLALNAMQALSQVWPTYDVHVYYDSGRSTTIEGVTSHELVPMYPFTYFHSHEGPLYGFSHSFQVTSGATLTEIRPNVYLIKVPSEGTAEVMTAVKAYETPVGVETKPPPPTGPPPPTAAPGPTCPPPVEKGGQCGCRVPGGTTGDTAPYLLFGAGALALVLARRRARR